MSEYDKEEFIKRLREIMNHNRGLDVKFLMHEQDPMMFRTYEEFLDVINKGDYNKETLQFLRGCYKMHEILQPCICEDDSYVMYLMDILMMENMQRFPEYDILLDWDKKIEVLNISQEYMNLLYHVLNHHKLIEHGTSIRYSWLTEKGEYILDETYDGTNALITKY